MAEEKKFEISLLVKEMKRVEVPAEHELEVILEFETADNVVENLTDYLRQIEENPDVNPCLNNNRYLERRMIRILEDNFRLKVKICGNCDKFIESALSAEVPCQICLLPDPEPDGFERPDWEKDGAFAAGCKYWASKENPHNGIRVEFRKKHGPPPPPPSGYKPNEIKAV